MENKILQTILKRKTEQKQIIADINICDLSNEDKLSALFDSYICNRFYLSQEDVKNQRNIISLAKLSLVKAKSLNIGDIKFVDGKDCSGATSSMTKKVLLLMDIEKNLNVVFSPEDSAEIDTIDDLLKLYNNVKGKE
jgi:acyl carrier protein